MVCLITDCLIFFDYLFDFFAHRFYWTIPQILTVSPMHFLWFFSLIKGPSRISDPRFGLFPPSTHNFFPPPLTRPTLPLVYRRVPRNIGPSRNYMRTEGIHDDSDDMSRVSVTTLLHPYHPFANFLGGVLGMLHRIYEHGRDKCTTEVPPGPFNWRPGGSTYTPSFSPTKIMQFVPLRNLDIPK